MRSQRSLTQARKVCEKGEQKSAERIPLVIRADQVVSSVQNYAGRSAQKSKGCTPKRFCTLQSSHCSRLHAAAASRSRR